MGGNGKRREKNFKARVRGSGSFSRSRSGWGFLPRLSNTDRGTVFEGDGLVVKKGIGAISKVRRVQRLAKIPQHESS